MKRILPLAVIAFVSLQLYGAPLATAQPILKRVEEMLRDQLGGARPADAAPERGYLGIIGDDTPDGTGVVVLEVYPGQPGAQGGLASGDVITAIDGRPIRTMDELVTSALDKPVGTKLTMTVSRGGEARRLNITLGKKPGAPGAGPPANELPAPDGAGPPTTGATAQPGGPRLGVRTVAVTSDVQQQHNLAEAAGAHVIFVAPDSAAAKAGIPLGAVITGVGDTPIRSPEELAAVIRASGEPATEVTYVHAGRTQRARVELVSTTTSQPPLVETQVRKAQGPALGPADASTAPQTPPAPKADPPAATPTLKEQVDQLIDRVEALERRIDDLERKSSDE